MEMYLNDKYLSVGWLGEREEWFLILTDNACRHVLEARVKRGEKIMCKAYPRTIRGASVGTPISEMGKLRFRDVGSNPAGYQTPASAYSPPSARPGCI